MLPFGLPLVVKTLKPTKDGRGNCGIFIGTSETVPGGVIAYNTATNRVIVGYQFTVIPPRVYMSSQDLLKVAKKLYKDMAKISRTESGELGPGSEKDSARVKVPWPEQGHPRPDEEYEDIEPEESTSLQDYTTDSTKPLHNSDVYERSHERSQGMSGPEQGGGHKYMTRSSRRDELPVSEKLGGIDHPVDWVPPEVIAARPYQTRNVGRRVMAAVQEEGEADLEKEGLNKPPRPPKPIVPSARVRNKDPRWIAAGQREAQKLIDAQVLGPLPVDKDGNEYVPHGSLVHRILPICDYKWKEDPATGEECWLESVRMVSDGSVDQREGLRCYAETPERVLLFMTLGLSATSGEYEATADVVRAYLNADSLDDNIVIETPAGYGLPHRAILKKGLYGERRAALGWELYIDGIMTDLMWKKLDICRGMYRKDRPDGVIVRALRHSDDLKLSASTPDALKEECDLISQRVKMSPWKPVSRFLGVEIERINLITGLPDALGQVVLVRQREKIDAMIVRFKDTISKYHKHHRVRQSPGPLNVLKKNEELLELEANDLDSKEAKIYQEIVGVMMWVTGARPDIRFHVLILSKRCVRPRVWDMFCAVWAMKYLEWSRDAPLVLGGPVLDPQTTSDSSFATMDERETVLGYGMTTGPLSGAIEAVSKTTKSAVTSVWETELSALVEAAKAEEFLVHACDELGYDIPLEHKVFTDNMGVQVWSKGDSSNKRSRHIDIKYHYIRHAERDGRVTVWYVPTIENYADILTKGFTPKDFRPLMARILGHYLVQGLGIQGVIELST